MENNLCAFENCDRARWAKGYCAKHYYYAHRHGILPRPQCKFENCESPSFRHGFCNTHNLRYERYGDPSIRKRLPSGSLKGKVCFVDGCGRNAKSTFKDGEVYCSIHYWRISKNGDPNVVKKLYRVTPEHRKATRARASRQYNQSPYGKLRAAFNEAKGRVLNGKTDRNIPKEEFLKLWNTNVCGICSLPVSDEDKSLDHIITIAKGGSNFMSNLQIAHLLCNQKKSDNL